MRRKSGHQRRRRSGSSTARNVLAVLLIIAVLVAFASIFLIFRQETAARADIDPVTLCLKSHSGSVFAVLVDRTDALTKLQHFDIAAQMRQWAHQIPEHGLFVVYEVGRLGSEGILEPIVRVCNPGNGAGAAGIVDNPKLIRQTFESKYVGPIERMLGDMEKDEQAKRSPILEGVQQVAVREFELQPSSAEKQLVIISDLLENVDGFSLYKGVPELPKFIDTPYARTVTAPLSGVEIKLRMLLRASDAGRQTSRLVEFWMGWLAACGGHVTEYAPVGG